MKWAIVRSRRSLRARPAIAPAMNHRMWLHPATQANIETLRARGVSVLGPDDGPLAEGESGPGRLMEPQAIVAALAQSDAGRKAPSVTGTLRGLKVVIDAGPTYEDIDPVRFLGNRSSGRMGFAIAEAARRLPEAELLTLPTARHEVLREADENRLPALAAIDDFLDRKAPAR